jgi:hypothetical protein
MNQHGSSEFLQRADAAFGNAILVMSVDTGEG